MASRPDSKFSVQVGGYRFGCFGESVDSQSEERQDMTSSSSSAAAAGSNQKRSHEGCNSAACDQCCSMCLSGLQTCCTRPAGACCTRGKMSVFYLILILFSVVAFSMVFVSMYYRGINSSQPCPKDNDYYYDDSETVLGNCWQQLVDVQARFSWYDISGLATNGAVVCLSCGALFALLMRKKLPMFAISLFIIACAMAQGVTSGVTWGVNKHYTMTYSRYMIEDISDQLRESLWEAEHWEADTHDLWEQMQSKYDCCGVRGFHDFKDFGIPVPKICYCEGSNEYEPYSRYCSNRDESSPSDNSTRNGCLASFLEESNGYYNGVIQVHCIVMFSVAGIQFLVTLLSLFFIRCSVNDKKKTSGQIFTTSASCRYNPVDSNGAGATFDTRGQPAMIYTGPRSDGMLYKDAPTAAAGVVGGRDPQDDLPLDLEDDKPIVA